VRGRWLERYLTTKFKGTLLLVSHDRHFLNAVVTDVCHFHLGTLTTYKGDINNFVQVRDEQATNQKRQREVQEDKRKHLQEYIDKHAESGENGQKAAKQRKSKMKKLERLGMESTGSGKYKVSYQGAVEEVEEVVEEEEVSPQRAKRVLVLGMSVALLHSNSRLRSLRSSCCSLIPETSTATFVRWIGARSATTRACRPCSRTLT